MGKKKFYVVWHGVSPGIYTSWTDCKLQINGFEGAIYKSFDTQEEAERAYNTSPYLYIQKKRLPLRQFPETHRQTCRLIGTTPCYPFRPKSRPKLWQSTRHAVVTRVRWNTEAFISVRAKPSSISDRCMAPIISVNFWPLYMPWL